MNEMAVVEAGPLGTSELEVSLSPLHLSTLCPHYWGESFPGATAEQLVGGPFFWAVALELTSTDQRELEYQLLLGNPAAPPFALVSAALEWSLL